MQTLQPAQATDYTQPKRGALRRQACIDQHNQENLKDPWVPLSNSFPEELPEINHHHRHHTADKTQLTNIHNKAATMNDDKNISELNGIATDVTSDPPSNMISENTCETPPGAKMGPPVAPKPVWFRQSLTKIQDEQDQKRQAKPAEQRPSVGFNRGFGVRCASSATNLSIKQKIHSFETYSRPEETEMGCIRRPLVPSTSPVLMEKESRIRFASHGDYGKGKIPQKIQANQSASPRGTDNKNVSATSSAITSSTSEASSQTAKTSEDKPLYIQSPTDLPLSDTISTYLNSEIHDCDSAPIRDERSVFPCKPGLEKMDLTMSTEDKVLPPATALRSNQAAGESHHEGMEEYGAQSQEKLLSTPQNAALPTDSNPLRSPDGESLEKILVFSNQVSQALMRALPMHPCHGNPRSSNLQDNSEVDITNPQESEHDLDSTDRGFSVSLATLRDCTIEQGEGGSHNQADITSACAHSFISAISSQEIQGMIQEVKVLNEETLKVHRVFPSGLAAQEGTIQKGDEVLSINGQTLRGVTHADATAAVRQARSLKLAVVVICKRAEEKGREGGGCRSEEPKPIVEEQESPLSVELEKGTGGVGFTLEGGKGSIHGDRPLVINRIFKGGAAEQRGLQHGDELLQVQGISLQDMTRFEAWNIIKALPTGPITAVIRRRQKVVE
ncbi:pro-interleukin-16 isoform X2 [Epinephelus fuscoguttatus]|uniref:pro-interleukin-16 isoform X2 n=1 Tax=Epinephelus fuscoguttatus TaxID=293821 RepID=UPI0020D1436A|nr:pro-interleukin-16 isoform X2 [Epinephelus fuscoguttatus]